MTEAKIPELLQELIRYGLLHKSAAVEALGIRKHFAHESLAALKSTVAANKQALLQKLVAVTRLQLQIIVLEDMLEHFPKPTVKKHRGRNA